MLWGSKRTGPDLARVGGKYSDFWHVAHLTNPRDVVPESNMPAYRWLARTPLKTDDLALHLAAQRALGVPYTDEMVENAASDAYGQATPDSDFAAGVAERYGDKTQVSAFDGVTTQVTEMDALVAYLQVLGRLTGCRLREHGGSRKEAGSGRLKTEEASMDFDHDTLVAFSKSWGLFYLIALRHLRLRLHVLALEPETVRRGQDTASSTGTTSHGSRANAIPSAAARRPDTSGTASRSLTRRFPAAS